VTAAHPHPPAQAGEFVLQILLSAQTYRLLSLVLAPLKITVVRKNPASTQKQRKSRAAKSPRSRKSTRRSRHKDDLKSLKTL
jgi:hypothetical protein